VDLESGQLLESREALAVLISRDHQVFIHRGLMWRAREELFSRFVGYLMQHGARHESRPVTSRGLPASETQNAAGVISVVAAEVQIDRAVALNTARDDKRRRRREQYAARRARLAQDPVAAAAALERDAAIRVRRRKRLRDTDPEAFASAYAEIARPQGRCAAEIFS